jgi:hypothetical protein
VAAVVPVLAMFGAAFPVLRFLYGAVGSLGWPLSTLVLCWGTAGLLPLLAIASLRARRGVIAAAASTAAAAALLTLTLPTYSAEWPQRLNLEYWLEADTGEAHYLAQCDCSRLPAALAAAAPFDPVRRPRFAGSESRAFFTAAPTLALAAPELSLLSAAAAPTGGPVHFELRLRSARGAPEAVVVFPAGAHVTAVTIATAAGRLPAHLDALTSGATLLDIVELPPAGLEFGFESTGPMPMAIQLFDQSFHFPREGETLLRARPREATSSQDGDITVVHRTVSLDPAAGRRIDDH